MPKAQLDQRAMTRFPLQLPVSLKYPPSREAEAESRDVSARGICFYISKTVDPGSEIEFTLTLPAEVTRTQAVRVECKGRVVRVEPSPTEGKVAIAAQIEQYEFLPPRLQ